MPAAMAAEVAVAVVVVDMAAAANGGGGRSGGLTGRAAAATARSGVYGHALLRPRRHFTRRCDARNSSGWRQTLRSRTHEFQITDASSPPPISP